MNDNNFPKLSSFLAAYFSPYWQMEYDFEGEEASFEAVTKHYKTENASHIIDQTTKELENLLNLNLTDAELEEKCKAFFNYSKGLNGESLREVLSNFSKVLKKSGNAKALKRIT